MRSRIAALQCQVKLAQLAVLLKRYNPNQPLVPAGEEGGGQWAGGGDGEPGDGANIRDGEQLDPQEIIATAKRLDLAARTDGCQKCLDLCHPLLERFQPPGSDRNKWDVHKCMDACLRGGR
jgi:hypothetical protein